MALPNPDDPTIPVGCADQTLPAGLGVEDCFDPTLLYGPGTNLLISLTPFPAKASGATTDDVTATEMTTKQAATDNSVLTNPIVCQLSKSSGTPANDRINGINYPKPGELTLNVTIQDLSQTNYDLMRRSQKGGVLAHFWFLDRNGYFYGGRNGIFGGQALLVLGLNLPTGETDLQTLTGTISAQGFFDPKRQISPIPYV